MWSYQLDNLIWHSTSSYPRTPRACTVSLSISASISIRVSLEQLNGRLNVSTPLLLLCHLLLLLDASLLLLLGLLELLLLLPAQLRKLAVGPNEHASRMKHIQNQDSGEHGQGVEHVGVRFMAQYGVLWVGATRVFYQAEDDTDLLIRRLITVRANVPQGRSSTHGNARQDRVHGIHLCLPSRAAGMRLALFF